MSEEELRERIVRLIEKYRQPQCVGAAEDCPGFEQMAQAWRAMADDLERLLAMEANEG